MPAITIEQAYAIAMNAYIEVISPTGLTGFLSCSGAQSGTSTSRFKQLFTGSNIDLGTISVLPRGLAANQASTLITAGNTPTATYTLVTSSTDSVTGIPLDYLVGGQIDNTSGTLSTVENNIHRTGRAIFCKIKK
jgi:hypothetical protein